MSPASILVIKPSSLGDVVHTLPAVARLRTRFPQSRLRWLVNPEWAPLLKGNPHLDEVLLFPRSEFRGLAGLKKIAPWVRSMRAAYASDVVVDFQGLLRSALIARLCCKKGGSIAGLSDAREGAGFFYDQTADVRGEVHAVDRYLKLAALVGGPSEAPLQWPLPAGAPVPGLEPGYVLLHPFSRGAGKSLSAVQVDEFCRAAAPMRVVVAGRGSEPVAAHAHVTNLLNATSLEQLFWLVRQAGFVVSVDSGPMHIAAAMTSRLVSIHTWSDPAKVGPYCPGAWIWQAGRLFQQGRREAGLEAVNMGALAVFAREQAALEQIGQYRA